MNLEDSLCIYRLSIQITFRTNLVLVDHFLSAFERNNPGAHLETRALRTQLTQQNETNKHFVH